jgi:hypothetical protein
MAVFESLMQMMVESGGMYVFLWLFFAAIFYGIIEKQELLGDSSASAGAALGASFFIIIGVFYAGPTMGVILDFAGGLGFIAVVIFGAAALLGLSGFSIEDFGSEDDDHNPFEDNLLVIGALIMILIALIGAIGFNVSIESALGGLSGDVYQDVIFPIAFLLFLLLLIGAAVDGGDEEE